jgi:hypothetical protein
LQVVVVQSQRRIVDDINDVIDDSRSNDLTACTMIATQRLGK